MKRSLLMLTALALAALACGIGPLNVVRGSGNVVTETYDVTGFTQVEMETVGTLYIEQGATDSLTVETDDNILPLLIVHNGNGLLSLSDQASGQLLPSAGITFRLTARDLRKVTAASSGNIVVAPIETERLEVQLNASGRVDMDSVTVDEFAFSSTGSGDFQADEISAQAIEIRTFSSGSAELAGVTDTLDADIGGSGHLLAGDLRSREAVVAANASGSATVYVTEKFDVSIDGSGDVSYYGDPAVTQSINASGRPKALGAK